MAFCPALDFYSELPCHVHSTSTNDYEKAIRFYEWKPNRNSNVGLFACFILKVTKEIAPSFGLINTSVATLNDMLIDIVNRFCDVIREFDVTTMDIRDLQAAVKLLVPGELTRHCLCEGTKDVVKYKAEGRTSLNAEENKVKRLVKEIMPYQRVLNISFVYLNAVLDYLIGEVIDVSSSSAKDCGLQFIGPYHIRRGIDEDEELSKFLFQPVQSSCTRNFMGHCLTPGLSPFPQRHPVPSAVLAVTDEMNSHPVGEKTLDVRDGNWYCRTQDPDEFDEEDLISLQHMKAKCCYEFCQCVSCSLQKPVPVGSFLWEPEVKNRFKIETDDAIAAFKSQITQSQDGLELKHEAHETLPVMEIEELEAELKRIAPDVDFSPSALHALRAAGENYLLDMATEAKFLAFNDRREDLRPEDFRIALKVQSRNDRLARSYLAPCRSGPISLLSNLSLADGDGDENDDWEDVDDFSD